MDWIKKLPGRPDMDDGTKVQQWRHFHDLSSEHVDPEMSVLAEYFLSFFVIEDAKMQISFPIENLELAEIIKNQLTPHFHSVKNIGFGGPAIAVNLSQVRDESKRLFETKWENQSISPFVLDLRGNQKADVSHRYQFPKNLHWYQIRSENFPCATSDDFEQIAWFLLAVAPPKSHLCFMPTNWTFGDHLRESLVLQCLNKTCREIILSVDADRNLVHSIEAIPLEN